MNNNLASPNGSGANTYLLAANSGTAADWKAGTKMATKLTYTTAATGVVWTTRASLAQICGAKTILGANLGSMADKNGTPMTCLRYTHTVGIMDDTKTAMPKSVRECLFCTGAASATQNWLMTDFLTPVSSTGKPKGLTIWTTDAGGAGATGGAAAAQLFTY